MIRVGESGKIFRYATGYDMSSFTALELQFTSPSGAITTKTNPTVVLAGAVTDPYLGPLVANTYMQITIDATLFTVAGTWTVCGTYTNSGTSPSTVYEGAPATFSILAGC